MLGDVCQVRSSAALAWGMGLFLSVLGLLVAFLVAGVVWGCLDWAMRRRLWRPWMLLVLWPLLAFWPVLLAKLS